MRLFYNYKIAGRTDGSVNQTEYSGTVEADSYKEALLAALADCFGDSDQSDPIEALTATGWIDRHDLEQQLECIGQDDENCEFCNDDLTFVVEVY